MTNINEIWKFNLRRGNSDDPRNGACLLDAVSWLEYGVLDDHPACVCPVLAAFGRSINDAMRDEGRQRLKLFIPRLVGTVDSASGHERAEYLAWQAIRVFAPMALDAAGLHERAQTLRAFKGTLKEAAAAAAAAWAATASASAKAAAWAATASASAKAAAWAAAWAAAEEAAWASAKASASAKAAAKAASAKARAEDAMIAALEGALQIGKQAEPILPARFAEASKLFETAAQSGAK